MPTRKVKFQGGCERIDQSCNNKSKFDKGVCRESRWNYKITL